ncbi:uncharacterized protein LOC130818124 [Amaranthus tricolor]|uniref:uncharacterized protein LOC130818124 n=1 Tax=Amaranthus tricolor TaxID=29722 RepID=UPI00258D6819|nr:uncharacterized protein LOC130818124 [Amaranthus tricolor]
MLQSLNPLPPYSLLTHSHPLLKPSLTFLHKPISPHSFSSNFRSVSQPWPLFAISDEEGPIELSPDVPSIFSTNDDPTPLQVSTSVLLTGAITVFLFRSVRRRAKRAKELRMRSSGAKTLKEEALDSLKAIGTVSIEPKSQPSAIQAFLGAITAGVIALILYKFTTTIEAALNRQSISDNFSVRQITVTIRTIINGLCYLATFVFGMNSVGLFLYSGQLALNSFSEDSEGNDVKSNEENKTRPSPESPSTSENKDTDQIS